MKSAGAYNLAKVFVTSLTIFACIPATQAQEPKKIPRIGGPAYWRSILRLARNISPITARAWIYPRTKHRH
jgi:hypothetical protein